MFFIGNGAQFRPQNAPATVVHVYIPWTILFTIILHVLPASITKHLSRSRTIAYSKCIDHNFHMFIHGIGTIHKLKSIKIHNMIQDVFVEHYGCNTQFIIHGVISLGSAQCCAKVDAFLKIAQLNSIHHKKAYLIFFYGIQFFHNVLISELVKFRQK